MGDIVFAYSIAALVVLAGLFAGQWWWGDHIPKRLAIAAITFFSAGLFVYGAAAIEGFLS